MESWRSQPLFADEPPAARALARADHLRNRPDALAATLRGLGAGAMEPLWGRLAELAMPVEVVVGERDTKYLELARRMLAIVRDARLVVLRGGHGLPLENPRGVADALLGA